MFGIWFFPLVLANYLRIVDDVVSIWITLASPVHCQRKCGNKGEDVDLTWRAGRVKWMILSYCKHFSESNPIIIILICLPQSHARMAQICRIDVRAVGGYVLFGHIPCNLQESCPPQKAGCLSNTPVFAKCLVDWLCQLFWPIQMFILWVIASATAAAFAAHHHSSICRSCGQRGFSIAAICWISAHWIVAVPVDSIVVHLKHLSIERLPIGLTMGRLWPDWMQYQSNPAYTHLTRFMAMMFCVQAVVCF